MEEAKDVSAIQDEDVLRRMWQTTEDSSKKKEIRAHMYKLRENRLKEFYTSGEVLKDVQRSNSSPGLRDQPCAKLEGPTHADSLADHSFLSLKTKEIRDSESPTRDVQYRNSKNRDSDGQWTITSKTSKSDDGKRITNSQLATTQGIRSIDNGQLAYAAANEHQASVYEDGDDKNYTRSVGETSKTFAQENVVTGDKNSFNQSKSTSSSTSSKVVSHSSKILDDNFENILAIDGGTLEIGMDLVDDGRFVKTETFPQSLEEISTSRTVNTSAKSSENLGKSKLTSKTVYTSDPTYGDVIEGGKTISTTTKTTYTSGHIPEDLKKSIADGNTKVITETKTLPDGSIVTTNRYETKETKKYGTTSGSTHISSSTNRQASSTNRATKNTEYIDDDNTSKTTYTSGQIPEDLKKSIADGSTKVFTETKTLPDGSTITTTRYETIGTKKYGTTSGSTQITSSTNRQASSTNRATKNTEYIDDDNTSKTIVTSKTSRESYDDDNYRPHNVSKTESIRIIKSEQNAYDTDVKNQVIDVENKGIRRTDDTRENVKVTRTKDDQITREQVPKTKEIYTTVATKTIRGNVSDEMTFAKPKGQLVSPQSEPAPQERPEERRQHPQEHLQPSQQHSQEVVKSCKPQEKYHPSNPTDGQYSTTYGSEFTNKRVSVDVSPTHDAFARSLRSITPDRISERQKSRSSVLNSTSSLRSSTSPDKHPKTSPERKGSYDRRSPDKYTRHNTSPSRSNEFSPERKSPERKPSRPDSITICKRTSEDKKSPSSPTKIDLIITKTTRTSPMKTDSTSPLRSPSKEKDFNKKKPSIIEITVNTDTITRKKKTPSENERKSPVRSPTRPSTAEVTNVDTTTINQKKNTCEKKSPVRSPTRSTTTDVNTINSDTITRKKKVPEEDRKSPVRSPTKTSTVIITDSTTVNTDTITRKKKTPVEDVPKEERPEFKRQTEIDESEIIITEKSKKPNSRDLSPTSLASDIEFINHNSHIVTDLDEPVDVTEKRPTTLEITETVVTTKEVKPRQKSPSKGPTKIPGKENRNQSPTKDIPSRGSPTKDSPTKDTSKDSPSKSPIKSPVKDSHTKNSNKHSPKKDSLSSPVKEVPKMYKPSAPELNSPSELPPTVFKVVDNFDQVCEVIEKEKPPLKRTETYEERCRQILGLAEPDTIEKKNYDDIYAGMEPVEEPLFVKKTVVPLGPIGPEDVIIQKAVERINRRTEFTDDEIEPIIDEFIKTEGKNVESGKPKSKVSSSPERKIPRKQKPGEYNTEYTDEYNDKPNSKPLELTKKTTRVEIKPSSEPKDIPKKKSPVKSASPERKYPQNKLPKDKETVEGEYNTEYTDEYCERGNKPSTTKPSNTKTSTTKTSTTTVTTVETKSDKPERKLYRESPERKPQKEKPLKKAPENIEFSTEYTDEYCETTKNNKNTTIGDSLKPRETSPRRHHEKVVPSEREYCGIIGKIVPIRPVGKHTESPRTSDITPIKGIPSLTTNKPEKKGPKKTSKPDYSTDEEELDECITKTKINTRTTDHKTSRDNVSPVRDYEPNRASPIPDNQTVTEYINEYSGPKYELPSPGPDDFISREKYDTDITIEETKNKKNITERKHPSTQLPDVEFNIENENTQTSHIRTHRVDTTIEDVLKPRETSPRRHPQKAIPSDTMECTFTRTVTEDDRVIKKPDTRKPEETKIAKRPQKSSPIEDKKAPVKQPKERRDSVPKVSTKILTKKVSANEITVRRQEESPKKRMPTDKTPKEKSPERYGRSKLRSPSPRTNTKRIVETHITRKTTSRDIPIKKSPDKLIKPSEISQTSLTSPAASPERKPQKHISKPLPTQQKITEVSKHTVMKTIALTNQNTKPQITGPKTSPKTITSVKTTKITQPSSVTTTTVKTNKTSKKTTKPCESESSSSESEYEEIIDVSSTKINKKKVVTTAIIKLNNAAKQPNVSVPPIKVNNIEVPITTYQPIVNNIEVPITTYQPIITTDQPNITTDQPNITTDQPIITTDKSTTITTNNNIINNDHLTTKCITTKSIILNQVEFEDHEFLIDLQRSTSSREASPDKICPIPVSSEDEGSYPRYPDQVSEPDDLESRKKPFRISDIPLTEEEDVREFSRITEIEETKRKPSPRISNIDRVQDTDESLLSVTEKVSRFITSAEKLTDDEPKSKKPAPKIARPELIIDKQLENDECLLSVSDKVTKFVTTAEEVSTKSKTSKSPRPRERILVDVKVNENDECLLSVNEKVSHFIQAAESSKQEFNAKKGPAPKVDRPEFNVPETLKTDECLLSVSDKVNRFLTNAEKLITEVKTSKAEANIKRESSPEKNTPMREYSPEKVTPKKEYSPEKIIPKREYSPEKITSRREYSPEKIIPKREYSPEKIIPTREYSPENVSVRRDSVEKVTRIGSVRRREPSPERPRQSPSRKSPENIQKVSESVQLRYDPKSDPKVRTKSGPKHELKYESRYEPKSEPKTEPKSVSLKSSEAVRKAKEMFENISKQEAPKQRDILSRPSVWEGRKKPQIKPEDDVKLTDIGVYKKKEEEVKKQLVYSSEEEDTCRRISTNLKDVTLKSTKLVLNENRPSRPRDSPEKEIPGYMRPKSSITSTREELTVERTRQRSRSPNPNQEIPRYLKPIQKPTPDNSERIQRSRSPNHSTDKDIPGYMRPKSSITATREEITVERTRQHSRSPNHNHETPGYLKPIQKPTPDHSERIQRSRSPNPSTDGETPGYMRPIPKVSVEERDNYILETRYRESLSPDRECIQKRSNLEINQEEIEHKTARHHENGEIPHYMFPLDRSISPEREFHKKARNTEEIEIVERTTEKTPEGDLPGYMKPLHRHTHTHTSEKHHVHEDIDDIDEGPKAGKKFGVTLRRTDSGRMVTNTSTVSTTVTERRRSSTPGQVNVEEIQDLEVLERMMDTVVGYEQRRRIRAQIRVVKKIISDNKIVKRAKPTQSPIRYTTVTKSPCEAPQENRGSPIRSTISPSKKSPKDRQKSPEPKQSTTRSSQIETKSTYSSVCTRTQQRSSLRSSKDRSLSPEPRKLSPTPSSYSSMYKQDLKRIQPASKISPEDKPSWVMNRNLKKTTSETVSEKRVVAPVKKPEVITRRSPSPQKEAKPTDCITSSYGIGPTDENGKPLFGIRALRKAAADTSKVQVRGTVVTSQFYSENGQEPVGEVTVTNYSNNPKELHIDDEQINKSKGLTSVTTTQKFGSRGAPTLSSIVDKKKAITDKQSEEDEIFKTTSSKVTRRGSVKALSQKFIENAVEISRNERQNYPKAGLILRTSSFKETTDSTDRNGRHERSSSRESSPGHTRSGKVSLESLTTDSRQTQQTSTTTKTFLNSHSKVADAQEIITRMKNAENEHHDGDSADDREARMLLNKFLGAQALMSGMEPILGKSVTQTTSSSASAHLVRKVQKKTTTTTSTSNKESSKPLALTKRFQTPITAEVLQNIWDEQTLRALLEQCTDYEERRAIRARLRQVMAEQEAVANVVANAVLESGDQKHSQERIETSKKTFSEGPVTTTEVSTTRVIQQSRQVSKPISPFAKFRQLDKQNSVNTPPSSPRTPTGTGAPLFKFTDPALCQSASTVKERLLQWCQIKTKEYQNIQLDNFSTSWADGMAFCALIHHFLPDSFDYHALNPKQRRHNFTLAFKVADEQADIFPLLDVDDMVAMRRPDWKCVFTYVQSIYRRFKDDD